MLHILFFVFGFLIAGDLEFVTDNKNEQKLQKTANFENQMIKYIYRGVEYFKSKIEEPKFLIWSDNFENLDQ